MLTDCASERRLKTLIVTPPALQRLAEEGEHHYRAAGLPKDAQIAGAYFDYDRQQVGVIFEHPSFEVVPDGHLIPELEAVFTDLRC